MTRVALYARVSTNDQTVAPQLDALRGYGSARGLEVVHEFVDQGISGSADRRPALNEMIAAAHRREFDEVACVKLDRLARRRTYPPRPVRIARRYHPWFGPGVATSSAAVSSNSCWPPASGTAE